jgi:ribosomal protein S18 acetylase RimI-like enzyme
MILRDWRGADCSLLRSCYEREQRSWQDDLGWDTTWTWATVEQARVSWGLPGVLAFDDAGALQGWAFAMKEGATLHIGGLVASSPAVTTALVDGLLGRPCGSEQGFCTPCAPHRGPWRAGGAPGKHCQPAEGLRANTTGSPLAGSVAPVACFIRHRAPGLIAALANHGLEVERFLYLSRPLAAADAHHVVGFSSPATAWNDRDFAGAANLLQASYSGHAGRHFAPSGSIEEWAKYLSGVVQQAGCGLMDRDATRVQRDSGTLQALALVTSIHRQTAHLAQLVVHPDSRGCGVATRLIREALACAAQRERTAMTLLVGEQNESARRLYASLGFMERATFVAARTPDFSVSSLDEPYQPERLSEAFP